MSQAMLPPSVLINPLITLSVNGVELTNIVQLSVGDGEGAGEEAPEAIHEAAALERSAARFAVVSGKDNAPRAADVERILREKSMIVTTEEDPISRVSDEPTCYCVGRRVLGTPGPSK